MTTLLDKHEKDLTFKQLDDVTKTRDEKHINPFIKNTFFAYVMFTQSKYGFFLDGIMVGENVMFKPGAMINNSEFKKQLNSLINELLEEDTPSVEGFAKVKYYLDLVFYSITDKGELNFKYNMGYLITPSEAAKELNVSRQTVYNYAKNGLEWIDTSKSNHKVPKHALFIWKNPHWATRVQILHNLYKIRRQNLQEKYDEICGEIRELESRYGSTFEDVFKDVIKGQLHGDELDNATDYMLWSELRDDQKKLYNKIKG